MIYSQCLVIVMAYIVFLLTQQILYPTSRAITYNKLITNFDSKQLQLTSSAELKSLQDPLLDEAYH